MNDFFKIVIRYDKLLLKNIYNFEYGIKINDF